MTDDKFKEYEGDQVYLEDMAPPPGQEPGEGHLTPEQIAETRITYLPDEAGRKATAGAFLLSRNDAKYLLKASIINVDTWTRLLLNDAKPGAVGGVVEQETLLQEVDKAWRENGISATKLQRIYKKTEGKDHWHYRTAVLLIPVEDAEGRQDFKNTIVVYVNDTVFNSFPYEEKGHEIIEAENPIDRARIAGVPEGIKYLPYSEQMALDDLRTIVDALADIERGRKRPQDTETLLAYPSSPLTNIYSLIGTKAIEAVQREAGTDFNGNTLSMIIPVKGVTLTGIDGNEKLLLDPEADRILMYFLNKSNQEGYKSDTFVVPASEIQEAFGIKDPKDARAYIKNGLDIIVSHTVEATGKNYHYKGHIVSSGLYVQQKGRRGSFIRFRWDPDFFEIIQGNKVSIAYIPRKLLQERHKNAYKIGRVLTAYYRTNAGRDQAYKIGVQSLLKATSIPTYENLKDRGKASERIITPFINALNRLTEDGILARWDFMHRETDEILTDEEYRDAIGNYKIFSKLLVSFTLADEPDYSNIIENRKKSRKTKKAKH